MLGTDCAAVIYITNGAECPICPKNTGHIVLGDNALLSTPDTPL